MRPGSSAASFGLCRSLCIYRLTAPVAPGPPTGRGGRRHVLDHSFAGSCGHCPAWARMSRTTSPYGPVSGVHAQVGEVGGVQLGGLTSGCSGHRGELLYREELITHGRLADAGRAAQPEKGGHCCRSPRQRNRWHPRWRDPLSQPAVHPEMGGASKPGRSRPGFELSDLTIQGSSAGRGDR